MIMAGVPDEQLIPLGPWPEGVDNVHKETELKRTEGGPVGALLKGVNVDISDEGKPERRAGYVKRLSLTSAHSFWRKGFFPYMLYVDSGTMYAWQRGDAPIAVNTGLANREVSYAFVNDRVRWSNGHDSGVIFLDLSTAPFGVETPSGPPTLAVGTNGGMPAGTYQVVTTFKDDRGEEGGATIAATIDVPEDGSILVSHIPQPHANNIHWSRLYMTQPNGTVLKYARDVPVGMTSLTLGMGRLTVPLATQFLDQMRPMQMLRPFAGRLFGARKNMELWSESLRFGLTDDTRNYLRIGDDITMLEPVGDGTEGAGIFVADSKRTYFQSGPDPYLFKNPIVYPHGAIKGTAISVPGTVFGFETTAPVIYWYATNGVACIGMPGGVIRPQRHDQALAPAASRGASMFRQIGDLSQIVTTLDDATQRKVGFGDRAVAKVFRGGVEV
jgi:hypothetical protein